MSQEQLLALVEKHGSLETRPELMKAMVEEIKSNKDFSFKREDDMKWFVREMLSKFNEFLPEKFQFKPVAV